MAITYPLTFPSQGVSGVVMRMRSIVAVTRSPFTGKEQVQVHPGRSWGFTAIYPKMERATAEPIITFLGKLDGRKGTFLVGDPNGATPRGSAADTPGTPLVVGSSQNGSDLDVDGLPAGASGYLLPGDYIQLGTGVNTHLHKVLDQVDVDSTGAATFTLWPELREDPVDGATVVVSGALGHFRLANNVSEFSIGLAAHYGISFSAIEALNVVS